MSAVNTTTHGETTAIDVPMNAHSQIVLEFVFSWFWEALFWVNETGFLE